MTLLGDAQGQHMQPTCPCILTAMEEREWMSTLQPGEKQTILKAVCETREEYMCLYPES